MLKGRKGQLPPMPERPGQDNILNAVIAPREWVENGKLDEHKNFLGQQFIQYASTQQATRVDVARLREMLD